MMANGRMSNPSYRSIEDQLSYQKQILEEEQKSVALLEIHVKKNPYAAHI